MVTVYNKRRTTTKLLLEKGARLDSVDHTGLTLLHFASHHGDTEIVRKVIVAKSLANVQDSKDWTPLHSAVAEDHVDAVDLLLANGADPAIEAEHGKSVLEFAEHYNRTRLCQVTEKMTRFPPKQKFH